MLFYQTFRSFQCYIDIRADILFSQQLVESGFFQYIMHVLVDSTGIHNLTALCEMSQKEKTTIILSGVNKNVHDVLEKAGFYELLGKENICPNINVALERAKSLVE